MSKLHSQLTDAERHNPKGFENANLSTVLSKDENGNLIWVSKDDVGGSQGIQGEMGPAYTAAQIVTVQKSPQVGQFSSIVAALASITDNAESKRYVIRVEPGTYSETQTIVMKPYVYIEGSNMSTTIINGNFTGGHLIRGSDFSGIGKLTLTFPDRTRTGYALVYHENIVSSAANRAFSVKDCQIGESDIGFYAYANTLQAQINFTNCQFGTIYGINYLFFSKSIGSAAARITGQTLRPIQVASPKPYALFHSDGVNAEIVCEGFLVNTGGNADIGNTYAGGTLGKYGVYIKNGGSVRLSSGLMRGFEVGIYVENSGINPFIAAQSIYLDHNLLDIDVQHSSCTGAISAQAERNKVNINDASTDLTVFLFDIVAGGSVNFGAFYVGPTEDQLLDYSYIITKGSPLGLYTSTDMLSAVSGTTVQIASGRRGYLEVSGSPNRYYEISIPNITIDVGANADVYVIVDEDANVSTSATLPNTRYQIVLGRVVTDATSIIYIENAPPRGYHLPNNLLELSREALGNIYVSGSIVSENETNPFNLDISTGVYWFGAERKVPVGGTQKSFIRHYRDGSGGWNRSTTQTVNNIQWDNGSGTLQNLTAGYYAKHWLYISGDAADEKYFLVFSQDQYATLIAAQDASAPIIPTYFRDATCAIASVIVQQGQSNITEIQSQRPTLSFTTAGTGAVSDHGSLTGLLDDDHLQYLLANGARNMSGDLNMGGNDITNVDTVDGVDVSSHQSRHLPNGADPLTTAAGISIGDTNAVGTANSLARSDHKHKVTVATLSGGEFSLQQLNNIVHSTGIAFATDFAITDNGNGTIDIGSGTAFVRSSNSPSAQLYHLTYAGVINVALTDNSNNFLYIDYNAGTPAISVSTTKSTDYHSKVFIGQIYREGITLHIAKYERQIIGDNASILNQVMQDGMPFMRSMNNGGGILTETGTRNVAVSEFNGWHGLQKVNIPAIDTNTAGSFSYFYNRVSWQYLSSQTQFSNTQWDNAGTLTALSTGYYKCDWVYRETDGDLILIFGNQQHVNLSGALAEKRPATFPRQFEGHALLIGKIISKQGQPNAVQTLSVWIDQLDSTSTLSHQGLSDLNDINGHTWAYELGGSRPLTGNMNFNSNSITNINSINGITWTETRKQQGHDGSTGAINGGALSINVNNTKYDIAAGSGYIVDNYTDPSNPVITPVSWTQKLAVSPSALATNSFTHVYIDSSGNIIESTLKPSPELRRQYIYLGKVIHSNNIIVDAISSQPEVLSSPLNQVADYWNGLGLVRLSGNKITPNGANLSIDKSSGFLHQMGANWHSDKRKPNIVTSISATAATFSMVTQTNASSGNTTFIDPTSYDSGGVITSVPAGDYKAQNFRVFLFKTGTLRLQYGQTIYDSLADATKAITTENFIVEPNLADNAILLGIISVRRGATNLSDQDQARFFRASKFGEIDIGASSAGAAKLQGAYNNSLPAASITLDSVRGGIQVKDNSTPLGTDLLKVTNNAGSSEYFKVNSSGVSSSGTFNGVTVQSHAARHLPSGADPLATAAPVDTGTANAIGVAESFAKSDHVHKTVIANYTASATADTATTSTTYILLDSMTLTPVAGTYVAMFSSSGNGSTTGSDMEYTIFSGGAKVTHSERNLNFNGGVYVNGTDMAMHSQAAVTVNGSESIEVYYRVNAGTFTVHERSLILIKVG